MDGINTITNKELKRLLVDYPDESEVKLYIDGFWREIGSVSIEYNKIDNYEVPTIILTAD